MANAKKRRPVRTILTVAAVGGAAYAAYLVWCCLTGRSCCPIILRGKPKISLPQAADGVQQWGLRFVPENGDLRRAYAILIQPDGAEFAVNGGTLPDGSPDFRSFYDRLGASLSGRRVDRMIVVNYHLLDASGRSMAMLTNKARADLERAMAPHVTGGVHGISWANA